MEHVMFRTKMICHEALIDLFDKRNGEAYPYIVTWKLLKSFGKRIFIASIVDSTGGGLMTNASGEPDDVGYLKVDFEIVAQDNVRYTVVVSCHEAVGAIDIDISSES